MSVQASCILSRRMHCKFDLVLLAERLLTSSIFAAVGGLPTLESLFNNACRPFLDHVCRILRYQLHFYNSQLAYLKFRLIPSRGCPVWDRPPSPIVWEIWIYMTIQWFSPPGYGVCTESRSNLLFIFISINLPARSKVWSNCWTDYRGWDPRTAYGLYPRRGLKRFSCRYGHCVVPTRFHHAHLYVKHLENPWAHELTHHLDTAKVADIDLYICHETRPAPYLWLYVIDSTINHSW